MATTYLLLGSNEGDRQQWINKAIKEIGVQCGELVKQSPFYETAAWGKEDQPPFLNLVVKIKTELSPEKLLAAIQNIEQQFDRQRTEKWGQRTLDIDILFYGKQIIKTTTLTIPHPHLQERKFTLKPLNEIAPYLLHPVLKKAITTLLKECTDTLEVKRVGLI